MPTSSEFLKLLLFISNPMHDFVDIVTQTNEFIFNLLLSYDMVAFKPSTISIASLLAVCEALGFSNFQTGILELIEEHSLPFNMYEVQ